MVYLAIAPLRSWVRPPQIKSDNKGGDIFSSFVRSARSFREKKKTGGEKNRGETAELDEISIHYVISRNTDTKYPSLEIRLGIRIA